MATPYPSAPYPSAPYPPGAEASAPPPAGGDDEYKMKVELTISCKGLSNLDVLSKSDPCCCVDWVRTSAGNVTGFDEVGRTEVIQDNLNPHFSQSIVLDYLFEEMQNVRFVVYDEDTKEKKLRHGGGEVIGEASTSLGQIVSTKSQTLALTRLTGGGKRKEAGSITIKAEEVSSLAETLDMRWYAQKVDKKDFFGKSDPYLQFARSNPDGSFSVVHRTEFIKNTLNPSWKPFKLSSQKLCNSDMERMIQISCWDWDRDGSSDFIGSCETSLRALKAAKLPFKMDLINPAKKRSKKSYKNSGTLVLESIVVSRLYSFLDYITHGCELNFVVGVDFTGSNGDPRSPGSLHSITSGSMNEYQNALWSVGKVCEQYDSDKQFPSFGFGAKIPPHQTFSDIFPLNLNMQAPDCFGIDGIMAAYQQCVYQVKLWGPTNAAPIVNRVADMAQQEHQRIKSLSSRVKLAKSYYVLLLLTDGVLTDMQETKKAVIRASHLPMSIIIVGVGAADFKDMDELDGDDERLRLGTSVAERDIVQFVPFRKYSTAPAALAKEVLAEIPTQLVEYMHAHGLQPPAL